MTDIAIRVENPCPEPAEGLPKVSLPKDGHRLAKRPELTGRENIYLNGAMAFSYGML
jgi:hypothetical protein